MLSKNTYITTLRNNAEALADAADGNLGAVVPSCPEWTVAVLLGHLGTAYVMVARQVAAGTGEDVVQELEDLELPPAIEEWVRGQLRPDAVPPTVANWFREAASYLEEV